MNCPWALKKQGVPLSRSCAAEALDEWISQSPRVPHTCTLKMVHFKNDMGTAEDCSCGYGDMCEDEAPTPLEEERGESSSHGQRLEEEEEEEEEEESESAEPHDPSTTGASKTHTHGNTGGREHNTGLEFPSSPEVCPTVRSVELAPGVTVTQACVGHICLGVRREPIGDRVLRDIMVGGKDCLFVNHNYTI